MKLLFSAILFILAMLACHIEDMYLTWWPPQAGRHINLTIRSPQAFNFDQEKAFGSKRNIAVSQYTPVYSYLPDSSETIKKKVQGLIHLLNTFSSPQQEAASRLIKYLQKEFGVTINSSAAESLIQYANVKNLLEAVLAIQDSFLQGRIVQDPKPIKGKKAIEIFFPNLTNTVTLPTTQVLTLEEARHNLQKKIVQIFWQVDKNVLDPVIQIALSSLAPNLKYDQKENERRIEEIVNQFPSKIIPFQVGSVIVPFRKLLTEKDVLLIETYRELEKKYQLENGPWILAVTFYFIIIFNLVIKLISFSGSRNKPPDLLFLSILIVSIFFFKTALLTTDLSIYSLPVAMLPLLIILLSSERISAIMTSILLVILIVFFSGLNFHLLFFYGFSCAAALLITPSIRKRKQVLISSTMVGILNAIVLMFFLLDWSAVASSLNGIGQINATPIGELFSGSLFNQMGWAFLGGVIAGPLAMLLLPFFEFFWQTASAFKLNKYADLEQPLLKDLLTKAPGTYQHSMTVAYLAQASAEAIGANSSLVRIGAYYHDIGKILMPKYYIENQFDGKNPHDDLDPFKSVQIIIEHVRKGQELGRKAGIPKEILDFIPQHHGTLAIEYFYDKAQKDNHNKEVNLDEFRHLGPKPQKVETALVMIADAVEATSRTLQDPSREKIDGLVRHLLEKRITDGQFDECNLTTYDLAQIRGALTDTLMASFHHRVEYPWQKEQKAQPQPAEAAQGLEQ